MRQRVVDNARAQVRDRHEAFSARYARLREPALTCPSPGHISRSISARVSGKRFGLAGMVVRPVNERQSQ
jgi:hypothetical protein